MLNTIQCVPEKKTITQVLSPLSAARSGKLNGFLFNNSLIWAEIKHIFILLVLWHTLFAHEVSYERENYKFLCDVFLFQNIYVYSLKSHSKLLFVHANEILVAPLSFVFIQS